MRYHAPPYVRRGVRMTTSTTPPEKVTATAVVPPHKDAGPLTPAQLRMARARIAMEQFTLLVEDLETCPPAVRQAAGTVLVALLDLQALLQGQETAIDLDAKTASERR